MGFIIIYILLWIAMLFMLYRVFSVVRRVVFELLITLAYALGCGKSFIARYERKQYVHEGADKRIARLHRELDLMDKQIASLNDKPLFFHKEALKGGRTGARV